MCIEIHDKYKHGVKNSIHVYQSLQVQGWMEHVNLRQSCLLQKRMHYHVFFVYGRIKENQQQFKTCFKNLRNNCNVVVSGLHTPKKPWHDHARRFQQPHPIHDFFHQSHPRQRHLSLVVGELPLAS